MTLTSKSAYKNPSSPWHFIVENHHFGTKKLPFVWILSTRFCENCENVIWNKSCRNTVMVKAQKQWLGNSRRMMSRKQIEWSRLMIFLLSSVRTKSRSTQRERDCSQRTQELIFLMCKVDYTICSAFNGFNTTVLLSNWWKKLNPLYLKKKKCRFGASCIYSREQR